MGRLFASSLALSVLAALALVACSESRSEDLGCNDISQCAAGNVCLDGFCTSVSDAKVSASASSVGAELPVLVIDAQGNSCEASSCKDLPYGSQVTFRAAQAAGYRFTGWTGSPECVASGLELIIPTLTRDTNCVANYVRRIKVAGHAAGSEGGVTASSTDPFARCAAGSCEVDAESSVKLTADQRFGERFDGWSGPGCGSDKTLETTLKASGADLTCVANFVARVVVSATAMNVDARIEVSAPGGVCERELERAGERMFCTLDKGGSATLTAPPVKGFRFAGWSGTSRCVGSDTVLTLGALNEAQQCQGTYTPRVTVSGSSAGAEPPPAVTALSTDLYASCTGPVCETDKNGSVTLLASSASGYRLTGWSGSACEAESSAAVELKDVGQDLSCVANYVQGIAVIGAVVGAPGDVTASSSTPLAVCAGGGCVIDVGGDATLTAPSIPGYRFLGWDGDPGCASTAAAVTLTAVMQSHTCYARFATRFLVRGSASPTEGGIVRATSASAGATCSAESCTLDGGGEVSLEAVPAAGQRFSGWSGGGACTGAEATVRVPSVSGNVTCQANFIGRISAAATVAPTNGGSVMAQSDSAAATCVGAGCSIDLGSRVLFTATAAAGFRFTGWTQCADSTAPVLALEGLRRDTACQANFTPLRYSVSGTPTPAVGGSVAATATAGNPACTGGTCTVDYNSDVSLTATPAEGYSFAGWSGCPGAGTAATLAVAGVQADIACQATFSRIFFTLDGNAGAGGTVAISSSTAGAACAGTRCTVPFGAQVVLTATPQTGFQFGGWSGCSSSTASPLTLSNVMTSGACAATFTRQRFTVTGTPAPANGGSVAATSGSAGATCAGASCSVDFGGTVALVATPQRGFSFAGWAGCSSSTNASISVANVSANAGCQANFTRQRFAVLGTASPAGLGAVVASSTSAESVCANNRCDVNFGSSVTLVAAPVVGARFVSFSNCPVTGGASVAIPSVEAAATCQANFERLTFVVQGVAGPGGTVAGAIGAAECPNASCVVVFGGSASFTATPNTGFNVAGFTGCAPTANPRIASVSGVMTPVTCAVAFERINYTVAGTATGGGSITASSNGAACANASCSVPFGGSATFTAGPDSNAIRFTGFSGGCTATAAGARTAVVNNVSAAATCTANFGVVSYPVTGTTVGGGSITGSTGGAACANAACTVPFGGSATFTAGADTTALRFTGFSGACMAAAGTRTATVANVSSSATCTANFAPVTYLITGGATGGGSITGSTGGAACTNAACTVPFGGSATFTAGADTTAVVFTNFSGACTATANPRVAVVSSVAANATCTANFRGALYTVSGMTVGGGRITATSAGVGCTNASCSVPFGGSATFTAEGEGSALTFVGFSGDCVPATSGSRTATVGSVSANATCVATFRTATYVVTGTAADESGLPIAGAMFATTGNVECANAACTVPFGGSVSFLALPSTGNRVFQRFGGSCVDTGGFTAAINNVAGAGSCTAIYGPPAVRRATFTVQVDPLSRGQGTVTCGSTADPANNNGATTCTFPVGTVVNGNAAPGIRSTFFIWSGDTCPFAGNRGGTNSFTLDTSVTCIGRFDPELF